MPAGNLVKIDKNRLWALAGALLAIAGWGASFAVTRAAVREVPPLSLAFLRFSLAALLLWPVAARIRVHLAPGERGAIFALGFVGVTLYFACENIGLLFTTASHGALIVATIPLATELILFRRNRRRPPAAVLLGSFAALGGVALIFGRDTAGTAGIIGDALMFGAVFSWVGYTVLAERLVPRFPGIYLTWKIMTVGAVTLLPAALVEAVLLPFGPPSTAAWGGVLFLGIFCSAFGYLAWNHAIPVLGVSLTNLLIYLIPFIGVLTGVLALGEPFTVRIALGSALIVSGVVVAGFRRQTPSS